MKNKRYLLLIALWGLPIFSLSAQSDFRALASAIAGKATAAGLKRLAVASFSTQDEVARREAEYAQDDLIFALVEEGSLDILERDEIEKILKEKELAQSGLIDEKNSKQVGQWLGVDALVIGKVSLRRGGNELLLQLRLVDATTAKIVATFNNRVSTIARPDIPVTVGEPVVQIAILLDTSSSMDGLINQARAYLWKIVNELASAKQANKPAAVEVALYEYGKASLPAEENYLRMILPFTRDLDKVSEELFALRTNGGEEYVGAVVRHATENLPWSMSPASYRAIFVAGNEGFSQGPVPWQSAVEAAQRKGIYVNTIYCGPKAEGVALGWQAGAQAGGGSYSHIEQNVLAKAITTPYDKDIQAAGLEINKTYIPYGEAGRSAAMRQEAQDKKAAELAEAGAEVERQIFKSKSQYSAQSWDLVSEMQAGRLKLEQIDKENLPEEYRKLSKAELEKKVAEKAKERSDLQQRIKELEVKRSQYITEQQKKQAGEQAQSLDKALLRAVRYQAKRQNFEW